MSTDAEPSLSLGSSPVSTSLDCNPSRRSRVEGRTSVRVRMRGAGAAVGRQQPDLRRMLLQGRRDRCVRSRRGSLPHCAVGCKLCVRACVRAVRIGAENREGGGGAAAVASRLVGLVGLADVLWRDFQQSPSRRPKQRERLQWPYPRHLRGKGCMKAAERGGNGVRAASKAWEQAHRHLWVEVCPRDLGHRSSLCRNPSGHPAS